MADIRIKDLTTTASSTASDDFFAADGTTNGTRKLSAYSPSFGGNATVGGTLTVNAASGGSFIGDGGAAVASRQLTVRSVNGSAFRTVASFANDITGAGAFTAIELLSDSVTGVLASYGPTYSTAAYANGITLANGNTNGTVVIAAQGTGGSIRFIQQAFGNEIARFAPTSANLLIGGTTDIAGASGLKVFGNSGATNTTSGALQVVGGVGIGGAIYAGGNLALTGTGALIATSSADSMARIGFGLFSLEQAVTLGLSRRLNFGDALISRNLQGQSGSDSYITSSTTPGSGYGGFEIQHGGVARILVGTGATTANAVVSPTVAASFTTTTSAFSGTLLANATTNAFCIANSQTPASATATGTAGTIAWDTSYIYVCTATNTWKRIAIATW